MGLVDVPGVGDDTVLQMAWMGDGMCRPRIRHVAIVGEVASQRNIISLFASRGCECSASKSLNFVRLFEVWVRKEDGETDIEVVKTLLSG